MDERTPTMDHIDIKEFALFVALGGVAVGAGIGLAIWLLPWLLAVVFSTAIPGLAGLVLMRAADHWWRAHSEPEPAQTGGEGSSDAD